MGYLCLGKGLSESLFNERLNHNPLSARSSHSREESEMDQDKEKPEGVDKILLVVRRDKGVLF